MATVARALRPPTTSQTTPKQAAPPAAARTHAPVAAPSRAALSGPPVMRLGGRGRGSAAGQTEARQLVSAAGGGEPLPPRVRETLERSLRADLRGVRVHGDARARGAVASLSARAFTYGRHIFLGPGEQPTDLALMAHEAAHVLQQRGAPTIQTLSHSQGDAYEREAGRAAEGVMRGETFDVRERTTAPRVQRLGISDALNFFADAANAIPGYRMFTIILGLNPINMSRVERSAANIMRAIVEFIPGGNLITRALDTYGVFDRVGAWVEQQIATLGVTGGSIRRALDRFLDSLSWTDIFDLGGVWERAKRIFTEPIGSLIDFARNLINGILRFLREAVLRPLAALAEGTQGYDLLKAVLGQDPVTGEAVPRNADTLIGGFMKLIGQEEVWNNLKRANAVARAWAWFQGALSGLMGFVRQIPGMIVSLLTSIGLEDFLPITNLFSKVTRTFGGFFGSFLSWAGGQVLSLLQIIFEVVAPSVMPYVRRAAGAFTAIIRNPIAFVGNLVRAGVQGFRQFARNFLNHLRRSLIEWLTGTLSGAGVYIPQGFDLREIIKFALSVLGLTWQNIRQKLVRAVGETAVRAMEAAFDIVVTLVTQGPAAAWERIREGISNLREMVMEQVMTFVRERVVQAAITRLVTSLNPAGAFIQAIIATYNTVMFFVERLRQIARVVGAFIDSISAIAAGNVGSAAGRVETTMAGMLTLVISFLARIAGLGRVSDAVVNIVNRVRAPVDRALDRVIDWIVAQARRLGRFVAQAGVPNDPQERLRLGSRAALAVLNRFRGRRVGAAVLRPLLPAIRTRYALNSLEPFEREGRWWVRARINPQAEAGSEAQTERGGAPDTQSSAAVKARVAAALRGSTIESAQQADALLTSIYQRFTPQGLRGIRLAYDPARPDAAAVRASASVTDEVARLPVNATGAREALDYAYRFKLDKGRTILYIFYDANNKRFGEYIKNEPERPGDQHAEDVFQRDHLPGLIQRIAAERTAGTLATPPGQRVRVALDLNRLPCQRCSSLMSRLGRAHPDLQFVVRASSVSPSGTVQRGVEEDSEIHIGFIEEMIRANVQVEPLRIHEAVWNKLQQYGLTVMSGAAVKLRAHTLPDQITSARNMIERNISETRKVEKLIRAAKAKAALPRVPPKGSVT